MVLLFSSVHDLKLRDRKKTTQTHDVHDHNWNLDLALADQFNSTEWLDVYILKIEVIISYLVLFCLFFNFTLLGGQS